MRREREKSQPAIEVDDIKKIFGMLESPITHNSHELLSDVHCQQKRGFFLSTTGICYEISPSACFSKKMAETSAIADGGTFSRCCNQ